MIVRVWILGFHLEIQKELLTFAFLQEKSPCWINKMNILNIHQLRLQHPRHGLFGRTCM